MEHADRYALAEEFVEVALDLWDSWADDAIIDDPADPGASPMRGESAPSTMRARTIGLPGR